jgi:hypothetical protein
MNHYAVATRYNHTEKYRLLYKREQRPQEVHYKRTEQFRYVAENG